MRRFLTVVAFVLLSLPALGQTGLIFSEYVEGSGFNKALELYNGTGAPVNISNYRIQMYFNGNTTPGLNFAMAGTIAPGATYVVTQTAATDATIIGAANLFHNSSSWFNGDDAIVLRRISDNQIFDSIGQIGFDPGSEWGSGLVSTADNTIRRKLSVTAGDTNPFDAFVPSLEWDGFANNTFNGLGKHGEVIDPVVVREIYEIQGSGNTSPYAGQTVETRDAVVTAVGVQGFFIQTPDFRVDASAATSNGIYVFTGGAPTVAVGDQVDVKGTVVEFFDFTEYTNTGLTVTVDAHNMPLPAYFTLTPGYSNFEPLEGMLVRMTNGSATDGSDQFDETTVVASSTRPFRLPGINGDHYPEIFDVDPTGLGGAAAAVQIIGGASIELAEGPLAFDFGDYSIWTTSLEFTNPPYPRGARARNAGELTVGAQNMFRLFDDNDDPNLGDPVTNTAVYEARLAAISDHIRGNMGSPDILAVSEVEDLSTLSDLADRLNFDDATLGYAAYLLEGNDIGGIDVGFLVRNTVSVSAVEQLGANDQWNDPVNGLSTLNDRPPLLLRGSYEANGAAFPIAVVAVHQRSLIDADTARVQAKRQAQAENLVAHLNALPDSRIVVTGDFNAFEFNDGYVDVMGILTSGASLTNQVLTVAAGDRYSYIEEGIAQVLDHSLTSAGLNPNVRGMNFVHANADAAVKSNPASDHDGVVLFVMSDFDADGYADDVDNCATGDARPTVILDGCDSGAPNLAFEGGCTLADQINALHASARNHGQFVSSVGKLLNDLMKNGQLTGAEKGAIESCAAQMN